MPFNRYLTNRIRLLGTTILIIAMGSVSNVSSFNILYAGTILIAQSGQTAPDGNGTFTTLHSNPALNNSGQVVFKSILTGTSGGTTDDDGIFLGDGNTVVQIARESQLAPDGNGTYSSLSVPVVNASGQVGFFSNLTGTSGGSSDAQGIFLNTGGTTIQIARGGQVVPGGNGQFLSLTNVPSLNDSGQMAFDSTLTGTSGGGSDNRAVFLGNGTATIQIARESQTPPDANGTFSDFEYPTLNNSNQSSFEATLNGTSGGSTDNIGIFRGSSSGVTQIARTGQAAPDGNGTFGSFTSLNYLSTAGEVLFRGTLVGTSGGSSDNDGLFLGSGGALTQVVRTGQASPDGNGIFSNLLSDFQINASGQVAFGSFLTGTSGGSVDDVGIYLWSGGSLTQIMREGDAAPDGNGIYSGVSRLALNDAGQVAFTASFANTTTGDEHTGIVLTDGIDTVQVARTGGGVIFVSYAGAPKPQSNEAASLNDYGQVVYRETSDTFATSIKLFTPDLNWRESGNGDWDTVTNWTLSIDPAFVHDTSIDPSVDSTVNGPTSATTVKSLTLGGGSSLAHLKLQNGISLTAIDGVAVDQNGILSGDASVIGDLHLLSGGQISPGNSPGEMAIDGDLEIAGGSGYLIEVGNAAGTSGSGWDLLSISGSTLITSTLGDEFLIDLTSLDSGNSPGLADNFDASQSYSWTFLTADAGISGFDLDTVTLQTTNFQNGLEGGSFSLLQDGNSLNIIFTPLNSSSSPVVPEPSSLLLLLLGCWMLRRKFH